MKKLLKTTLLALGLLPLALPADAASVDDIDSSEFMTSSSNSLLRKTRFSIEAQTGSRNLASMNVLAPFMGDNDLIIYADAKLKLGTAYNTSSKTVFEGNLGLGIRRVNDAETAIWGAYAFYDRLHSVNDNTFQQATLGIERLGLTWDFRINAYLPFGKTQYTQVTYDKTVIDQHNIIEYYHASSEKATAGTDIELGRTLGSQKLRGYVGLYSFGSGLTGPRVRLNYDLNSHFSLNAMVQYDQTRNTNYLIGMRYSIGGIEAKKSDSIYNRLTDQVVRDIDIVTQQTQSSNINVDADKFWVVDTSGADGGNGTLESPFNKIEQAFDAAPENAIIIIKGANTNDTVVNNALAMKDGQTLWGGQNSLYWDFDNNRASFTAGKNTLLVQAAEGVKQTIEGAIVAANNVGIYGINLSANANNPQQNGILINNNKNVTLQDMDISGYSALSGTANHHGIDINGDSSVNLSQLTLNNNDVGIYANGASISADQISISNSHANGMTLLNSQLNADAVSIDHSTENGLRLENSQVEINNLHLNNNVADGLSALNSQVSITSLLSHQNMGNGINIENTQLTIADRLVSSENNQHGMTALHSDISINTMALLNNQTGLIYNGGTLLVNSARLSENTLHGLDLVSGNATFEQIELTNNGRLDQAKDSVDSIRQLNSALRIGSDNSEAIFNAGHINVSNNEAGIELIAGQLNVYQQGSERSIIDGNLGYGLFIQADNGAAEQFNRNVVLQNTDIKNTHQLNKTETDYTTSGHGILAERSNSILLNNVNVTHNDGNGVWLKRGEFSGNNIDLSDNGAQLPDAIKSDPNINLFNYGLRIEQVDAGLPTNVALENLTINNTKGHGILMTGGTVTINHLTDNNNQDGINYINGMLELYDATLDNNQRFGLFIHYDVNYAADQGSKITLNNTTISNTKNSYEDAFNRGTGHGIYIEGMHNQLQDTITLNNTNVDHNDGIGIYIENDAKLYVNHSQISFNGANNGRLGNIGGSDSDGLKAGGIYKEFKQTHESYIRISSSKVNDNFGSGIVVWGEKEGGYMNSDYGTKHVLDILDSTVENNQGPGVRMDRGSVKNSTLKGYNQFWEIEHKFRQGYFHGGIGIVEIKPKIQIENSNIENLHNIERRL